MSEGLPPSEVPGDDRSELLEFVQALRAAIEWQAATGTTGLPRDPDAKRRVQAEAAADPHGRTAERGGLSGHDPHGERDTSPLEGALGRPAIERAPAVLDRDPAPPLSVTESALSELTPAERPARRAPTAVGTLPVVRVAEGASLEELQATVAACRACGLCERRTQTVFSRGTGKSGLCFVGEGPGADEDLQGAPFVGAAGQLLDRMIAAMGIERDDVYVANIVKCRPPENRKPLPEEMSLCVPYLHRQLELVAPTVIVALGATALEGLLGKTGGITRHRGRFSLYRGKIAVMPTFHPAYLLRQPSAKREVWSDLQEVLRHMGRPLKPAQP